MSWAERDAVREHFRRPGRTAFPVVFSLVVQIPAFFLAFGVGAGAGTGAGRARDYWGHGRHGFDHVEAAATLDPLALVAAVLGVLAALTLVARFRSPGPVIVAAGVLGGTALALADGPPFAAVPLALAVIGGVARGARIWAWSTLAGVAVIVPIVVAVATGDATNSIRPLVVALVLTFLVAIGEVFRARRERYREYSAREAARRQSEAEAERVRIARELHDVLAHSLSQISVQAGVGLHLFDAQPDKARESLRIIKETSGTALDEVRGVLGFLRGTGDPTSSADRAPAPSLAEIPRLVASMQTPELRIELHGEIPGTPTAAVQLTAYRIVQEALTNVVRHSDAAHVVVTLRTVGATAIVSVVDDGTAPDPSLSPGRGLTGMRERAELLGGSLLVESGAGGGVAVTARLPLAGLS